ncbi:adhesin [Pseudomonas poae]|uniref:adhesin n=1 Tax=Pseudomonas poae TaxID=200451 RepID=UPI0030CA8917
MNRFWILLSVLGCSAAMADTTGNNATIDNAGKHYNGMVSINQAAGDQQQLSNNLAIAVGSNAQATVSVTQKISGAAADRSLNANAAIQGNAFSQGNGALSVNQSAGAQNQMINAVRVSLTSGPQSIDDSVMSQQTVALATDSGLTSTTGSRQVVTSDQAFTGSRGVVQVNQSAGVGNRVANTLNVRLN